LPTPSFTIGSRRRCAASASNALVYSFSFTKSTSLAACHSCSDTTWLTGNGVLERREYASKPPRYEYVLTVKGLELFSVLMVMVRWGDKWLAGTAGPPVLYRHQACGQISHVELHCSECGQPMSATDIDVLPGPGSAAPGGAPHAPPAKPGTLASAVAPGDRLSAAGGSEPLVRKP